VTARARAPRAKRRLGVFGGTFDPPHVGHLALAEWALEQLELDRVLFVPAGTPPHKQAGRRSSAAQRVAMTRAAVRGNEAFTVSTIETKRRGPSYTVDTLAELAAANPGAELWLLMGADMYATLRTWHEPEGIARHARIAVALRPGAKAPRRVSGIKGQRVEWLGNPGIEVSSSAVRDRARAGRSVRYLVPDAVARHIARHGLYRSAS
jgi:nicotinate-nucleotide adenylyltransferase